MKPPPESSQNRVIFGCHHLSNTAQTLPHAACWLCPLLGYFSYISVARTTWRAALACQTLRGSWAFQLQSQTAQLSAHEQPYNNKLVTSCVLPDLTLHSSQLSPKLNSSYEQPNIKKQYHGKNLERNQELREVAEREKHRREKKKWY